MKLLEKLIIIVSCVSLLIILALGSLPQIIKTPDELTIMVEKYGYNKVTVMNLISIAIPIIIIYLIRKNENKLNINKKSALLTISIIISIWTLLSGAVFIYFKITPGWDWAHIVKASQQKNIEWEGWYYGAYRSQVVPTVYLNFIKYGYLSQKLLLLNNVILVISILMLKFFKSPNNQYAKKIFFATIIINGYYLLYYLGVGKILSAYNYKIFTTLNCIVVMLGVYNLITKKFEYKYGIFGILLLALNPFWLIYSSYTYTDTLVMAPTMLALMLLYEKDFKLTEKPIKIITSLILFILAFSLKFPIIIVVIAIFIIESLIAIKNNKKFKIIFYLMFLVTSVVGYSKVVDYQNYRASRNKETQFPIWHWIAMGQTREYIAPGYFSMTLLNYSSEIQHKNLTSEEKRQIYLNILKESVNNRGVNGQIYFMFDKIRYNFTDPFYQANYELVSATDSLVKNEKNNDRIFENPLIYILTKSAQNYIYISLLIAIVINYKKTLKEKKFLMISLLMFIGEILFSLIWEARSRYYVMFVPILIVATIYVFEKKFLKGESNNVKTSK